MLHHIIPCNEKLGRSYTISKHTMYRNSQAYPFLQVAKYKRLDGGIEFVASITKSAAGKILRKDLKALYEQKFGKK